MKMTQAISTGITLFLVTAGYAAAAPANTPDRPRLILAIVVDQFREDYTTRFRNEYTGGIAELLEKGAVFPDAHQDHYPTVTAAGHATLLTGSVPATSGIIGNEWYDRQSGKVISSVEDAETTLTGDSSVKGASPHNLVVSTVGDELKIVEGAKSKVIGISMKDRAAILMVGRMADAAYWFDANIEGFVSSSWYESTLPPWVMDFNKKRLPEQYLGRTWKSSLHPSSPAFLELPASPGKTFYGAWARTPYANNVLEELAETALHSEKLGLHSAPDVLAVSFSANDVLGHHVGPDAPEVEEMCVQTDRTIAKLIHAAEVQVGGSQNLLVVFTADHGVAPVPEVNAERKLPGTRINSNTLLKPIRERLREKFGEGEWILSDQGGVLYLNDALIAKKRLSKSDVEEAAATTAGSLPGVARAYTRRQFEQHLAMGSIIDEYMARGFFAERSGDVYILMKPYVVYAGAGTNHGTPYSYDSHVPLIFYGWKVKPGSYTGRTGISDVAPTLAFILGVETPSGNVGHILSQMIGK
jgi:predicted AlkP superfamily pyrophosphatase or phosphodiesterase